MLSVSVPNMGIGEWLWGRLRELSTQDKIAQIFADDGSSWSYKKLFEHSVRTAVGLNEMGLKSGQSTLSLVLRNSHELFPIYIGSLMADIKIVPTVTESSAEALADGLSAAKSTHILTSAKIAPKVEAAIKLSTLDTPPKVFVLTDDLYKDIIGNGSHVDPLDYQPVRIKDPATHVAAFYFSSGTTGPQKCVSLSHRGMLQSLFYGRSSAVLSDGPILNITQCNWVTWVLTIARSVFLGRVRVFMDSVDMKKILDAIQKYKCDMWNAPPRVLLAAEKALAAYPGVWDVSSLKLIISVGDSLKDYIQERLIKTFGADIYQEYGSTEAGLVICGDVSKRPVLGALGKPCTCVKLVDLETGETIAEPNKPGELYTKNWQMVEYVGNPKATAAAVEGEWMPSGDLMQFDDNGNYFYIERIKEIFKYNGHQVVPSEIEEYISQIPAVVECAVVGKRDLTVGEYPAAFIVKRPDSNLTAEDVNNFIEKSKLPDWYKLRGGVIFTDKIPETASGKMTRKQLRDMLNKLAT